MKKCRVGGNPALLDNYRDIESSESCTGNNKAVLHQRFRAYRKFLGNYTSPCNIDLHEFICNTGVHYTAIVVDYFNSRQFSTASEGPRQFKWKKSLIVSKALRKYHQHPIKGWFVLLCSSQDLDLVIPVSSLQIRIFL